jgi:hypothetical protein
MRQAVDRFSQNVPVQLGAVIRKMAFDCDLHIAQMVRAGFDHWVIANAHRIDPEVYKKYVKLRHLDMGQEPP